MNSPTACQEFHDLPPLFKDSWLFDPRLDFLNGEELKRSGISASELCKRYLKCHITQCSAPSSSQSASNHSSGTASLAMIAAREVRRMLTSPETLLQNSKVLLKTLDFSRLRLIFGDPETPYVLLRRFIVAARALERNGISTDGNNLLDIDEMVVQNEKFIRTSMLRGKVANDAYLVRLPELCEILGPRPGKSCETLQFRRNDPPKGGFEVLDDLRPRTLEILKDDLVFEKAFNWITCSVLKGLDWNNILAAGPLVLTTLMLVEPSRRLHKRTGNDMIELYLYGLGPSEANAKVRHIYATWTANIAPLETLVVKDLRCITFYTKERHQSICIHCRLYCSPIHVLLSQDLDPLAIGYNRDQVVMLPRCARALETGYSTFTTVIVHGDTAISRPPTLMTHRLLRLAQRGFGLRILPSYVDLLKHSHHFFYRREQALSMVKSQPRSDNSAYQYGLDITQPRYVTCVPHARPKIPSHEQYRKPACNESGLKTLRRIALLGQDYIDRYFFSAAPLAKSSEGTRSDSGEARVSLPNSTAKQVQTGQNVHAEEFQSEIFDYACFERAKAWQKYVARVESLRISGGPVPGPIADVQWLRINKVNPSCARWEVVDSVEQFEVFMRHVEVWRLHVVGRVTYVYCSRRVQQSYLSLV